MATNLAIDDQLIEKARTIGQPTPHQKGGCYCRFGGICRKKGTAPNRRTLQYSRVRCQIQL
jgi:hypothetical protein